MFASLRSNAIFVQCSKDFLTGVGKDGLGWEGRCRDWRGNHLQVSTLKIPDTKTNQNRRQKVFNKGALRLCRGLDIDKYSVDL